MYFQPLLSVGNFVFRLYMVPDLMPPNLTELPTDATAPLVASWGLGTATKSEGDLGGRFSPPWYKGGISKHGNNVP